MKNKQITFRKLALPTLLSALLVSGCSGMSGKQTADSGQAHDQILNEKDSRISFLESSLKSERATRSAPATATTVSVPELLPPNAKSGECYARVFMPPTYKTETLTVLKKDASERIEIIPARYEAVNERVMVKEASERLEIVPAKYEWIEEKVMVSPAREHMLEKPAIYKTEYEKILDKPEHTVWKKGSGPITKINEATGEIMCLVTVPATYKTVTKRILVSPATTSSNTIPAKYRTIKKRVMTSPPKTRTVSIPAEYKTVKTSKLIDENKTRRIPVKAEYETITKRMKLSDGEVQWRPVLCNTNMNAQVGMQLQKALKAANFNPGPIDGVIGSQTMSAATAYQRAKGLPSGSLTMETLSSLGVKLN